MDKPIRSAVLIDRIAPNDRKSTEEWLRNLGATLCPVWFFAKGVWLQEDHVEDHETFLETVDMALKRLKADYAMWDQGGTWALIRRSTGDTRSYPSRAAAEMVAIHGG